MTGDVSLHNWYSDKIVCLHNKTPNPGDNMDFSDNMKTSFRYVSVFLAIAILWSLTTGMVEASLTTKQATEKSSEPGTLSFEDALKGERSDLVDMEQSLERWELLKDSTINEIRAYRLQNTAHENLLLILHTKVAVLETALNNNRLAINSLSQRIEEFEKIGNMVPQWMTQLKDRISIAEKRITELKREEPVGADIQKTRSNLKELLDILYEKKKRSEVFLKNYTELFDNLKQTNSELLETSRQLEERLESQEESEYFERDLKTLTSLRIKKLTSELKNTWNRSIGFLKPEFWQLQWANLKRSGGITQAIFIVLFITTIITRKKIRIAFKSIEQRLDDVAKSKRRLALIMLRRSFLLIAAAILLWLYDLLQLPHINYHFARFLNQIVFTLLLTRWGIDYLQYGLGESDVGIQHFIQNRFVNLIRVLRVLIIINLLIIGTFGSESVSTWLFRLAIETFLFIWALIFLRSLDSMFDNVAHERLTKPHHTYKMTAQIWSYMVFGGALLIDLIGYHVLAEHWLISWAETLALLLWAHIGWQSIREWHHSQKRMSKAHNEGEAPMVVAPVGWFLVQMARLLWLLGLVAGVLLAWAGSDFMEETLVKTFNLNFSVGSLKFSVKGMLLALIIFYITHVIVRIGKRFLGEKVLDSRDFERGLKDSIVTISTYVIWGLGILLALGVLGVNATSLAVVFGALSIGIGFGLQNIFNNFISGLILLFERPIQVGDYVEVNGIWAEVKKINVRSTVVQTFDNATVIIPNSDFISQQVTNWSFKDPRMRRHVDIGVAYGSDVELVRKTLLEIPEHIPQILQHPQPDVLFLDHADSALIFRLRYWAHVDNFYSTSSAVRFELDRRFRELGIEIAFPQRDIHIRSNHTRPSSKDLESESSDSTKNEDVIPNNTK